MKRAPLVLLVPLVFAGCDSPVSGKDAAPVGTVIGGNTAAPGTALTVAVPDGRFEFAVGEPTDDLPAYDEEYDRPADGASFVGVTWNWDFLSALPVTRTPGAEEVVPSVSLVADGTAYPIDEVLLTDEDDPSRESTVNYFGTAWVVVDGEPDDLAVRVEYDGLTQEAPVRFPREAGLDRGVARPLYLATDDLVRARGTCGEPAGCRVSATAVPYHQGVGWVASPDLAWLVVEVDVAGGAKALDLTLDGRPPAAVVVQDLEQGSAIVVFPVDAIGSPTGELAVDGVWSSDEGALESTTWTVPIG